MRALSFLAVATVLSAPAALAREKPVALKETPGREIVSNLCSGCHSLDYIRINAPFLNRQMWTAEVNKMITTFGAPIQQKDAAAIIDYLTANYGTPG